MEQAAFVELVRELAIEKATSDTLSQIASPPGRNLSAERNQRSAWFNTLSVYDRANVEYAVADAARSAAFGLLCILDGSRAIEEGSQRGYFKLKYIKGLSEKLIASSSADVPVLPLHELL